MILRFINRIEAIICGALLISIISLLFMQVISRYGFGRSISWAEELSRFGLLALVYISAAMGAHAGTHIRVTGHLSLFSPKIRNAILFIGDLIWMAFNITVIYQSILLIEGMNTRPLVSGALRINMQYVFALIPIGFSFQSLRLLQRWWLYYYRNVPLLGGTSSLANEDNGEIKSDAT